MGLLEGRKAIITGGGGGIGAAAARRFAEEGAAVAVLDLDGDAARAVAAEVGGHAFEVNVARTDAVIDATHQAAAAMGGLTDVFNIDASGMITMSAADAAARVYNCTPAKLRDWAIPRMRRQWAGAIVTEQTPFQGYPDLPRHVILAEDDQILALPRIAAIARQRLGVEPIVLPGDHSPIIARPCELAALFHRLAA